MNLRLTRSFKDLPYRFLTVCVVFNMLIGLATGLLLATRGISPTLIYIGMIGLNPLLFLLVAYLLTRPLSIERQDNMLDRWLYYTAFVGAIYFLTWSISGFLVGQHVKDALGGSFRALIPFCTILVGLYAFSSGNVDINELKVRRIFIIFIVFNLLSAVVKIYLLSTGKLYGGGAHQYSVAGLTFSWLCLVALKVKMKKNTQMLWCGLILFLVLLTVLSLKRAAMIELACNTIALLFLLPSKKKLSMIIFLIFLIPLLFATLTYFHKTDALIARFYHTFSGNRKSDTVFDLSVDTRRTEVKSAFQTLNDFPPFFWLIGAGPGAGYNDLGYGLHNLNKKGEPYHIHIFWGIVIYRFGIFGVIFYLNLLFLAFAKTLSAVRKIKYLDDSDKFHPLILNASFFYFFLVEFIHTTCGNALYGNFTFGMSVVMVFALDRILKRKYLSAYEESHGKALA